MRWPGLGELRFSTRPLGSSPRSGGGCFLSEDFFLPALHDFGMKQENHRFTERLGQRPAAGTGATPASTRASSLDLARIRQTASCLHGVRPEKRGELLIQGWRGLPASKDLPAPCQGRLGSGCLPLAFFPRMFWLRDRVATAAPGVRSVSSRMGQPWVSLAEPPRKFRGVGATGRNRICGGGGSPPVLGCPQPTGAHPAPLRSCHVPVMWHGLLRGHIPSPVNPLAKPTPHGGTGVP